MGWRFRRGIRLLPGVRLNLSRGLPSVSVGTRGLTTNIGRRGVRTTAGLPGSGLSYTSRTTGWRRRNPLWLVLLIAGAVLVFVVLAHR